METNHVKKIRKRGDFYVIRVNMDKKSIHGIYFDPRYEKLVKLKDRQVYLWFCMFTILETLLRTYIFEIVIGMLALMIVTNILFHILFVNREERVDILVNNMDLYDVLSKKHKSWQKAFTMTLIFVCLTRLIIFVQPGVVSDERITMIYIISLLLSLITITFWIYYGKMKNTLSQPHIKKRKKNVTKKQKKMRIV